MYELPNCECGEELEFDEDRGFWRDGNVATMASFGHCPKCERRYRWLDHFTISHLDELEEDE